MERIMTADEKIRRAEEIYRKRREGIRVPSSTVNTKKNYKLLKRIGIQLMVCSCIYLLFVTIQNGKYIFSESFLNKSKEILSYNVNLQALYDTGRTHLNSLMQQKEEENTNVLQEENIVINNIVEDIVPLEEIVEEPKVEEIVVPLTDAEYIKQNFSFISPLQGTITSRFGGREVDAPEVTPYHMGIDIAANTGTVIIASISGTVTRAGYDDDLGNFITIRNGDIATIYGHCSSLYVNEGDEINQGQQIAEVGSTGRSTGSHLHFQVEREGRLVNPDDILSF